MPPSPQQARTRKGGEAESVKLLQAFWCEALLENQDTSWSIPLNGDMLQAGRNCAQP
jgi:hypothetical protein